MNGRILLAASAEEKAQTSIEALVRAGAERERLQVITPTAEARRSARRLAAGATGLVLLGGADIHPRYYGEEILPEGQVELNPGRDELELELLAGARRAATPTWGICRGLQVINVFLGGSLWQHLPAQLPGTLLHDLSHPRDALIHPVLTAVPESSFGEILRREVPLVNSRHHQGIKRLAEGLTAVGHAPDGLIEAVAWSGDDWWLEGVQWHPENLVAMAQQRALWERFVAAARHRGSAAGAAPVRLAL